MSECLNLFTKRISTDLLFLPVKIIHALIMLIYKICGVTSKKAFANSLFGLNLELNVISKDGLFIFQQTQHILEVITQKYVDKY